MIGPRTPPICMLCQLRQITRRQRYRDAQGLLTRFSNSATEPRPRLPDLTFPTLKPPSATADRIEHEWMARRFPRASPFDPVGPSSRDCEPETRPYIHLSHKPEPAISLPRGMVGPVSHEQFRHILRTAPSSVYVRASIRLQLLECNTTRDLLRTFVTVMQHKQLAAQLVRMYEPLMRALYRCRRTASDPVVLGTLHAIIVRFRGAGLEVNQHLYQLALKFAARTRSLPYMKQYLKLFHDANFTMSSNVFRSIIAKFSIGRRGLGEIRNGRWQRSDLLQVLSGFDDCRHLPSENQFHLATYVNREDWQFWHGWIAALSRCKDHVTLSQEWELWKQSDGRRNPRRLQEMAVHVTTKSRGDYWFLEQMCHTGAVEKAWALFRETDLSFEELKPRIVDALMDGSEYAGEAWNEDVRQALLVKYDRELGMIEKALGVAWVPIDLDDESQGYHVMIEDQESVLERLAAPEWKFREDFGYPYDQPPVHSSGHDRSLHSAEPTTLVRSLPPSQQRKVTTTK